MRGEHTQTDSGGGDITQYTWDHRNRLVKVEHRASYAAAVDKVVEYAYDYQNRWVRKRLDADRDGHTDQRRLFAYDGNQIVMDFWRANSGDLEIGHLRERYLWGPAVDQILAEEEVDGGTADLVAWTLTDHLNTVRDIAKYDPLTDTTTVVNHLVYDAFGRVTPMASRRREPAVDSLFLFTARPFDADTGLQNNLHRWYAPAVGRWLSEDPIGYDAGDGNLYRYVCNTVLLALDPTGRISTLTGCLKSPAALWCCIETGVINKGQVVKHIRNLGQDRVVNLLIRWGGKVVQGGGKGSHVKVIVENEPFIIPKEISIGVAQQIVNKMLNLQ
ncbi:RHS repeat domain-containing protein [Thermopirellula anaerolimosa]